MGYIMHSYRRQLNKMVNVSLILREGKQIKIGKNLDFFLCVQRIPMYNVYAQALT